MFNREIIRLAVRARRGQDDISVNQIGVSKAGMTYSESCNDDFFASGFSLGTSPRNGFFFDSEKLIWLLGFPVSFPVISYN